MQEHNVNIDKAALSNAMANCNVTHQSTCSDFLAYGNKQDASKECDHDAIAYNQCATHAFNWVRGGE